MCCVCDRLPGFTDGNVERRLNEFFAEHRQVNAQYEKMIPDPRCPPSALTRVAIKVLNALRKYPALHDFQRMVRHMNQQFSAIPLQIVLFSSWPVFPIIQSLGSMAWRSHGVFNSLRTEHYLHVLNSPELAQLSKDDPGADVLRDMRSDTRKRLLLRTKKDHPSSFCRTYKLTLVNTL